MCKCVCVCTTEEGQATKRSHEDEDAARAAEGAAGVEVKLALTEVDSPSKRFLQSRSLRDSLDHWSSAKLKGRADLLYQQRGEEVIARTSHRYCIHCQVMTAGESEGGDRRNLTTICFWGWFILTWMLPERTVLTTHLST